MRKAALALLLMMMSISAFAAGSSEDDGIITIWHSNSGKIGEAFEALVENFNETTGKENGITIEAVYQGAANDVLTKVKATAQHKPVFLQAAARFQKRVPKMVVR